MVSSKPTDAQSDSRTPVRTNSAGELAFDLDTLASITSAEDVQKLFESAGLALTSASDLGDGFALTEKDRLVGTPFIALQWKEHMGDFGPFVAVHVVTRDAVDGQSKFVFVDGSSGIREQLAYLQDKTKRNGGLVCNKGLRTSEYLFCETCKGAVKQPHEHQTKPATTYYIDTSA